MWVGLDWNTSTSGWQDRKIEADATPWPGYDLRQYPTIEFDARVLPGVSQQTEAGLQVVGQGWDGAGDNMNVQWTVMANLQLSTSWTHYSISTLAFPHYLNRLTLNAFEYGSYPSAHTELEFDNITLIPVPEPSVAGLLALGFVTVLLGRRRQA
jgi:hypothetical protein